MNTLVFYVLTFCDMQISSQYSSSASQWSIATKRSQMYVTVPDQEPWQFLSRLFIPETSSIWILYVELGSQEHIKHDCLDFELQSRIKNLSVKFDLFLTLYMSSSQF